MSPPETPRTWTLDPSPLPRYAAVVHFGAGAYLHGEAGIKAYEAAPVDAEREQMLDLLERAREVIRRSEVRIDVECSGCSPLRREIEALLHKHGRLGDS